MRKISPNWLYFFGLLPALYAFILGATGNLGADPVKEFEHFLGIWSVRFLIITLFISPLRVLASINLMRFRRAFGLLTFWYAFFHLIVYLTLDLRFNFQIFIEDLSSRPFIIFGMLAFFLLLLLALTSNNWSIKHFKKKWLWIHRLVYPAALIIIIHFYMARKLPQTDFFIYSALIILLLGFRVYQLIRKTTS